LASSPPVACIILSCARALAGKAAARTAICNTSFKPIAFTTRLPRLRTSQRPLNGMRSSPPRSVDVEIKSNLDDLNRLFHVHNAGKAAELVGHQNAAAAELVKIIFDVHGPMRRESPIHAAADDPAVAIVRSLEVKWPQACKVAAADVVFVSRHRKAASAVKQNGVEGVTDPSRHACKKVVGRLHERKVTGIAGGKADERAAPHGRTGCGALDADDGVAGELI